MNLTSRFTVVSLMFTVLAVPGVAGQFSFAGSFSLDNDIQLFTFSLLSSSTVTVQTWSYGGGVNANGALVARGGFEPVLQLYDAPTGAGLGTFIPGTNSSCPPNTADSGRLGVCYDLFGQLSLSAGNYILALAENPNLPIGDNSFAAGFQYDSDPSFNTNGFMGSFGFQGDSHWAVDILSVDAASQVGVPEPGTVLLVAAGVLLAAIGARKIRPRTEPQS